MSRGGSHFIRERHAAAKHPGRTFGNGQSESDPFRSGPAVAIVASGTPYLVDFGPGVVRRAAAAAELKGVKALAVENLRRAFLTHLHSDHTAGYADLVFTPWVLGRCRPLEVYGPPGLRHMTDHLLKAYGEDIEIRVHGLEHAHPEGYKVNAHEIKPGLVYRDDNVKVRAFRVAHGTWRHAYGYRFETADRTIVISGDTVPHPEIVKHSRGCDVLVHEVFSQEGLSRRTKIWQAYHTHFHTSTVALANDREESEAGIARAVSSVVLWRDRERVGRRDYAVVRRPGRVGA